MKAFVGGKAACMQPGTINQEQDWINWMLVLVTEQEVFQELEPEPYSADVRKVSSLKTNILIQTYFPN